MNREKIEKVVNAYHKEFGEKENVLTIESPGRINLIGEHVDYNQGLVLPAAIDRMIYFALSPNHSGECVVKAIDLDEKTEFAVEEVYSKVSTHWSSYIRGVIEEIKKRGHKFNGFNCVFGGEIPLGAGLSSSAALEGGISFGLNQMFDLGLDRMELAYIGQAAEHNYVGVNCGIMDQFANLFGKENSAMEIDCKTMDHIYHPADFQNVSIILINTKVSHSLGDSQYNQRRLECEAGLVALRKHYPQISSLRDANMDHLASIFSEVPIQVYERCCYVINEIERVRSAIKALEENNFHDFGKLMYQSHDGLNNLYDVSCDELNFLVELSMEYEDIFGARMMGGGFGGCTINLVKKDYNPEMITQIKSEYKLKYGIEPEVYKVNTSNGTNVISI